MKCKCPNCGLIHTAKEYDPTSDRERASDIDYEAHTIRYTCPGVCPEDAVSMAKNIVDNNKVMSE